MDAELRNEALDEVQYFLAKYERLRSEVRELIRTGTVEEVIRFSREKGAIWKEFEYGLGREAWNNGRVDLLMTCISKSPEVTEPDVTPSFEMVEYMSKEGRSVHEIAWLLKYPDMLAYYGGLRQRDGKVNPLNELIQFVDALEGRNEFHGLSEQIILFMIYVLRYGSDEIASNMVGGIRVSNRFTYISNVLAVDALDRWGVDAFEKLDISTSAACLKKYLICGGNEVVAQFLRDKLLEETDGMNRYCDILRQIGPIANPNDEPLYRFVLRERKRLGILMSVESPMGNIYEAILNDNLSPDDPAWEIRGGYVPILLCLQRYRELLSLGVLERLVSKPIYRLRPIGMGVYENETEYPEGEKRLVVHAGRVRELVGAYGIVGDPFRYVLAGYLATPALFHDVEI